MGFFDSSYEQSRLEADRDLISRPPATLGESFFQDLQLFWRENLSISRGLAVSSASRERAKRIRELEGDEAFFRAIHTPGDPATQQMIAELAEEHEEISSDSEIRAEIKERNRILREERNEALENQTLGGKIGGVLGTLTGAMTDPFVLATLPFSAPLRGITVLRAMVIEAGIGAATEAVIQVPVFRYKRELESPYDLGDALINIASAGVGAAALTGVVRAGLKAIRKTPAPATSRRVDGFDELLEAGERVTNPTEEQMAAMHEVGNVAEALRQSPFERVHPELDELHLNAMRKAEDDLLSQRPVDVSEFIEQPKAPQTVGRLVDDIDPEDVLSEVGTRERVSRILAEEDVQIRVEVAGGALDARGELPSVERSAREVLQGLKDDIEAGQMLRKCLLGG